jgi:hypothetical protein
MPTAFLTRFKNFPEENVSIAGHALAGAGNTRLLRGAVETIHSSCAKRELRPGPYIECQVNRSGQPI